MIRLRIERAFSDEKVTAEGLVWYEDGRPVGRVIIEEQMHFVSDGTRGFDWVPVEVIDG